MNIPILILNRDRRTCVENLCTRLLSLGYGNIHIIDIDSTYKPLKQWYSLIEEVGCGDITIHYFDNIGHKGIWDNGFIKLFDSEWVVITDSDIELSPDTPKGFIEQMITVAKDYRVDKVGLAIKYKGITNKYLADIIEPIEGVYWKQHLVHQKYSVYVAPVDSTFCIVKSNKSFQYDAIRIANWPIKHLDWYMDFDELTDEQQYYMDHADESIATTKQHYLKWLQNH